MSAYVAVAYRWGWLNAHQYFIYAGPDSTKADALANAECNDRGGKYGCAVWEFSEKENGEQDQKLFAYYPSSYGEASPFHNYRIDMFEKLGQRFSDFANGTVYLPEDDETMKWRDGKPLRVLKPHKIEPPQWVIDEAKRQQYICDVLSGAPLEPETAA